MLAKVTSCALVGLEGAIVEVEVDISRGGLPGLGIVGLPDAGIQEAKERVRSALQNSGLRMPYGRVLLNLAPADLRKEGSAYDLPIAVALLLGSQQLVAEVEDAMFVGELSLDGSVRHVNGVLPMASLAKARGYKRLFVPRADAQEASLVEGLEVYGLDNLIGLLGHLQGELRLRPTIASFDLDAEATYLADMADIAGQEHAKRALEVAAAGGHNVLMSGPPGAGKTLLSRSVPGILPRLTLDEALDVTRIYSVAGLLPEGEPLVRLRPFRSPHHTISHAGLVGGGSNPRPGEISLAHRGVLFLDELPEFDHRSLETLRQPLEDREVTISRARGAITFPASFVLVGAMNPCPCGYFGDPTHNCTCGPSAIARYQQRLSGPLLDRFDIHVEVPAVDYDKLSSVHRGEPSAAIRARVEAARQRGRERLAGTGLISNADMGPAEVRRFCALDTDSAGLMRAAMQQLNLSARAYHRVLKLARTIADLAAAPAITTMHLAEAIQYRPRVGG
ncbi:MAG: YifB family Mg chelatase-like AAA ATPase [Anaerolineae bacterium]